jgi:polynucleotide 5'-hydroxyl-kinase GRC3/NOL9
MLSRRGASYMINPEAESTWKSFLKRDELELILKIIEGPEIHRIRVSGAARTRSVINRARYRKKKFDDYFGQAASSDFVLRTNEVQFLYRNRPFRPEEGLFKSGILIGLNHNEDTIALGILEEISATYATFRSPLKSLRRINRSLFGDIIY